MLNNCGWLVRSTRAGDPTKVINLSPISDLTFNVTLNAECDLEVTRSVRTGGVGGSFDRGRVGWLLGIRRRDRTRGPDRQCRYRGERNQSPQVHVRPIVGVEGIIHCETLLPPPIRASFRDTGPEDEARGNRFDWTRIAFDSVSEH